MEPSILGWLGGIGGSIIGTLGGAFGTYCSIKNTSGPRERAFVIRAAILCWIVVIGFLAGMLLIPPPYRYLLWLPYAPLLTCGIRVCNRRQQRIRGKEASPP